jgi:hypothetical protein
MKNETLVARDANEIIWIRIARLKSTRLCEELLRKKQRSHGTQLSEEIIQKKAIGVSSAITAAIGYWKSESESLNARILSRYYALLQMTIAEQVASVKNVDDLASIQRHTVYGHGMATIEDIGVSFPDGYYSFLLSSGHFAAYLKFIGYDLREIVHQRRLREMPSEKKNLISISELFRSIPELRLVCEEYLKKPALTFHVGHAQRNSEDRDVNIGRPLTSYDIKNGKKPVDGYYTYAQIYSDGADINLEYLKSMNLPLKDLEEHIPGKFTGKAYHAQDEVWWPSIQTYKSDYSATCLISPLFGVVADAIPINVLLLYNLSIICRYLPDLWHEMTVGKLNHFNSLIEHYLTVFDEVVPLKMLERISEAKISIPAPGSLMAPV